jgi:hypothetical protein
MVNSSISIGSLCWWLRVGEAAMFFCLKGGSAPAPGHVAPVPGRTRAAIVHDSKKFWWAKKWARPPFPHLPGRPARTMRSHNKSDKVFFSESFQLLAENKIPGQKRVVKHMLQWLLCLHLLVG